MYDAKIRIMFVCYGNICRSPMAEYIFKKLGRGLRFFRTLVKSLPRPPAERKSSEAWEIPFIRPRAENLYAAVSAAATGGRFGLKKRITKISICSWGWTMATSLACAPFSAGIRIIRLKSLWILRAEATLQIRGTQAVSIRLFRTYSRACQHWRKSYSA